MDEDDFRAIIVALTIELRNIGADDLADETHYTEVDSETGEPRLMPPEERVQAMLIAFERFLAARDGEVARKAFFRIQQLTEGRGPSGAVLVTTEESVVDRSEIDLLDLPSLSEARSRILALAEQLGVRDIEPPPVLRA
jgi:hypothetical protein